MTHMHHDSSPRSVRRRWWTLPLLGLFAFAAALAIPAGVARADDDMDEEYYEEEYYEDDESIEDDDPSAVVVFRDELSPYGSWMDHPDYGTLWVPSSRVVGSDFAPYVSNGRWELTSDGDWLWVSDYDWGHIPFHYGRWVWVSDVGWSWIPGRVYAPAWVVWRTGADGYIGWAPAPPSYYWVGGYSYAWWGSPVAAYVFCPTTHVFHHHVHTVVVHDHDTVRVAARGTRPYVSAKPSRAHTAANPRKAGVARRGPSLDDAGIKKADAPKALGKHNAKATAFMNKDKIAASKKLGRSQRAGVAAKTSSAKAASGAPKAKAAGVAGFSNPARQKAGLGSPKAKPSPSPTKSRADGSRTSNSGRKATSKSGSNTTRTRLRKSVTLGEQDGPATKRRSGDVTRTRRARPKTRSNSSTFDPPSKSRGSFVEGSSSRRPKATGSRASRSAPRTSAPSRSTNPSRSRSVDRGSRVSRPGSSFGGRSSFGGGSAPSAGKSNSKAPPKAVAPTGKRGGPARGRGGRGRR